MPHLIVRKLYESFDELERSISSARKAMMSRDPVPLLLLKRIAAYDEMLAKQRQLADKMCDYIAAGAWGEVSRHIKLINGFSAMIHEDAHSLMKGILTGQEPFPGDVGVS